jgi:hypothetical protein
MVPSTLIAIARCVLPVRAADQDDIVGIFHKLATMELTRERNLLAQSFRIVEFNGDSTRIGGDVGLKQLGLKVDVAALSQLRAAPRPFP